MHNQLLHHDGWTENVEAADIPEHINHGAFVEDVEAVAGVGIHGSDSDEDDDDVYDRVWDGAVRHENMPHVLVEQDIPPEDNISDIGDIEEEEDNVDHINACTLNLGKWAAFYGITSTRPGKRRK